MTDDGKVAFGQQLRMITDKMNTPCEPFNHIDVFSDANRASTWDSFPEEFKIERAAYIAAHDYGEKVFVHGDLGLDNMLWTTDSKIMIIDFADSVLAPIVYEHALLVFAFDFDKMLLQGYFGERSAEAFADLCIAGLLIHDFGSAIVKDCVAPIAEITSLTVLREKIMNLLTRKGIA